MLFSGRPVWAASSVELEYEIGLLLVVCAKPEQGHRDILYGKRGYDLFDDPPLPTRPDPGLVQKAFRLAGNPQSGKSRCAKIMRNNTQKDIVLR